MVVLSLFDGMSCGQIALNRAGIYYSHYFASEIDKYAISVTQHNYPQTIQLGDVSLINIRFDGIYSGDKKISDKIPDLLIGGSPCQGFSIAGKQLNFEDPRSKLFFEYERILKEIKKYNPNVLFLLENVLMKKQFQDIISEHLGVQPVNINSSLVSAQNRERVYWVNFPVGNAPTDKNILLKDIIDLKTNLEDYKIDHLVIPSVTDNVLTINPKKVDNSQTYQQDRIYHYGGKIVALNAQLGGRYYICIDRDKSLCLDASYAKKTLSDYLNRGRGQIVYKIENDEFEWRKLTPLECERLQTVPDNYTATVSNSQRYKMLGNGWTVDVIVHLIKNIDLY